MTAFYWNASALTGKSFTSDGAKSSGIYQGSMVQNNRKPSLSAEGHLWQTQTHDAIEFQEHFGSPKFSSRHVVSHVVSIHRLRISDDLRWTKLSPSCLRVVSQFAQSGHVRPGRFRLRWSAVRWRPGPCESLRPGCLGDIMRHPHLQHISTSSTPWDRLQIIFIIFI